MSAIILFMNLVIKRVKQRIDAGTDLNDVTISFQFHLLFVYHQYRVQVKKKK